VTASIGDHIAVDDSRAIVNSLALWAQRNRKTFTGSLTDKQRWRRPFPPLVVSTDNDMPFDASNRQHRAFKMTVTVAAESGAERVQLQLPTAAVQFIETEYLTPMKQRMQALAATVRSADGVHDLQEIAYMQSVTYISPVFIPRTVDATQTAGHSITSYTSTASKPNDCVTVDERQYPHIVFYIVPYSTATAAEIADTVLYGSRADDKLTFVLQLPEGTPLHPYAEEMSLLMTQWLSSIAKRKLDMYLLPDDR
jgi:hypothetical protein